MNSYEVLYIITPELDEEATRAVIEKFKAIVADNGAEVVAVDEWGKRKLAYEIDYKKEGSYVLMTFNSNPDFPRELERNFPYWGKSCVKAKAASAPFEMIIRDTKNESQFTHFFVRQGDTSEIYLPNGLYSVYICQGPIWFNDEIGFGEFCESSDFGGATLDMGSGSDGTILKWHEWSPTF